MMPSTEVQIYGSSYSVRGSDNQEYLQGLADLVDRKMREIAQHAAAADPGRLAILAALNLADELFRFQQLQAGERVEIEAKLAALNKKLGAALQE
jgi:cell division protein ZapA